MWLCVSIVISFSLSLSEATLVRTDICNNDAIFAVDTNVIATSYDDVLDQISEQFLFKSFDIPVNGNNLSRAYRGHFATVATRDEQTCLTDGFLGLINTDFDLVLSVSGRMNGADDFVYDCGGCPEQDQLIQVDFSVTEPGVFGLREFLWIIDGSPEDMIRLSAGGLANRESDTLYLSPRVRVDDDRAFVIEYTPVCVDFNAWAAENVANSADRRCDTARSDNGTSFSFKGENCSLLCEEPYVMTSGPPDYNTVVSDTFTCAHDTEPEWEGEATCTQPCQNFSNWVNLRKNNWLNINLSNVQCEQHLPGTTCSVPCNPGFEVDGGTDLIFICDPKNAPMWTWENDLTTCIGKTGAPSPSPTFPPDSINAPESVQQEDDAAFIATQYGLLLIMGAGAVAATALYGMSRSCEKRRICKIRMELEQYERTLIERELHLKYAKLNTYLSVEEEMRKKQDMFTSELTQQRILFALKQLGKGRHAVIFSVGIALIDLIVDCIFVAELQRKTGGFSSYDGPFKSLPSISLLFVVLPAIVNLFAVFKLLWKEWQQIEMQKWFFKHSVLGPCVIILSVGNAEALSVLASRIFGSLVKDSMFNAPFTDDGVKKFYYLGLISNLLEDVPQLCIQGIVISNEGSNASVITIVAVFCSAITIFFGLVRRLVFVSMLQTERVALANQHSDGQSQELEMTHKLSVKQAPVRSVFVAAINRPSLPSFPAPHAYAPSNIHIVRPPFSPETTGASEEALSHQITADPVFRRGVNGTGSYQGHLAKSSRNLLHTVKIFAETAILNVAPVGAPNDAPHSRKLMSAEEAWKRVLEQNQNASTEEEKAGVDYGDEFLSRPIDSPVKPSPSLSENASPNSDRECAGFAHSPYIADVIIEEKSELPPADEPPSTINPSIPHRDGMRAHREVQPQPLTQLGGIPRLSNARRSVASNSRLTPVQTHQISSMLQSRDRSSTYSPAHVSSRP